MKIAAFQSSTLAFDRTRLNHYLYICHKKEIDVVVLSEYALNLFFKELESMPIKMIREQSKKQIENIKHLVHLYNLIVIAPIIIYQNGKLYKTIGKFTATSTRYYYQNHLIHFPHWDEKSFFANNQKSTPMTFNIKGVRFAVLFGYELHLDSPWLTMLEKNVDVVLMPTCSTFDSAERWREIIKTRAFLNGMYILKVNRVGEYTHENHTWGFYGDSLLCAPDGEIENTLGKKEELMIVQIDAKRARKQKKLWGFRHEQF